MANNITETKLQARIEAVGQVLGALAFLLLVAAIYIVLNYVAELFGEATVSLMIIPTFLALFVFGPVKEWYIRHALCSYCARHGHLDQARDGRCAICRRCHASLSQPRGSIVRMA